MSSRNPKQTFDPDTPDVSPPWWPWPRLIAHRGGGVLAPENTLAAFRAGQAYGFSMMEFDVKLSADNIPILLHDDTIDRTSDGSGLAADLTLAKLLRYDVGSWHSAQYAGEPIPTLYAIAAFTQANALYSNIEIKPCPGRESETGTAIATAALKLWQNAALPPLLSSFSERTLAAAQAAAPLLPRALLIGKTLPGDWRSRADRLGCTGLNVDHALLTEATVHDMTSAGYTLVAWTVNDLTRSQQLLDWGCHAIVTDRIDTINPSTVT